MKNTIKLIRAITLAVVIAFTTACGDGGGNNNSNNSNNNGDFTPPPSEDNVTLSGRLYYYSKNEPLDVSYEEYNGSDLSLHYYLYPYYYGGGSVTKGQFNFALTTFTSQMVSADPWFHSYFTFRNAQSLEVYYTDLKASPEFVKGFEVSYFSPSSSFGSIIRGYSTANSTGGKSGMRTEEYMAYWYADKDVTLSGKGTTQTNSDYYGNYFSVPPYSSSKFTLTTTTNDFKKKKKKGWNTVYIKRQYTVSETPAQIITQTETITMDNPAHLRWVGIPPTGDEVSRWSGYWNRW
jgi:hypothetical protein